ncbi:MAG: conjugal transfer protein TraD [Rhodocyclaceae bacterium]|uniref:conjugal transfer protein TraD n=1 Tax=unclassified Phenylobacterium TaxID=2640670 RepID=UPI00083AE15F|nr:MULTISPECIES: conjugal transfer protein TraD [unclassified Phenylobacterium]MBA3904682.1 conjugal transfer protein TraD [Rhodocyclaceae bacterium]
MARVEATRARSDNRAWAIERRARTRQLIELGGLVQKAGLVDLTEDDRAALLGAFLGLADMLKGDGGASLVEVWRRRGRKVFEAEQ